MCQQQQQQPVVPKARPPWQVSQEAQGPGAGCVCFQQDCVGMVSGWRQLGLHHRSSRGCWCGTAWERSAAAPRAGNSPPGSLCSHRQGCCCPCCGQAGAGCTSGCPGGSHTTNLLPRTAVPWTGNLLTAAASGQLGRKEKCTCTPKNVLECLI